MTKSPVEELNEHLGRTDDHVLLILYGHLLIEERLRDIIATCVRELKQCTKDFEVEIGLNLLIK